MKLDVTIVCEFVARWMGGTTVKELANLLGYSQRQATVLISNGFTRRKRWTAEYDPSLKHWISTVPAERLHGPKTALDALIVLQAFQFWNRGTEAEPLFPIVDTRTFRRGPAPDTFASVLGACVRKRVVDVVYQARTKEHAVSFSPHTLVLGPHRMHFRGYSHFEFEGESHYWDLVPSRVLSTELRSTTGYVDARDDREWHEQVILQLTLRPDIPAPMRQALRFEHRMSDDQLKIGPIRKALLPYVRSEYLDRRYEGFTGPAWDIVQDAK